MAAGAAPGSLDVSPLDRWPRRAGLFVDAAGEVNIAFNGLAAIALASSVRSSMAADLAAALTQSRGIRLPPSTINRQDDAIQAWPWSEGTFSWVEPTAWCLLGLKRLTRVPRPPQVLRRVDDGERLLADRACRQGGWNHGNSNMLGTELPPYVPPTAIALLALHDVAGAPHVIVVDSQRHAALVRRKGVGDDRGGVGQQAGGADALHDAESRSGTSRPSRPVSQSIVRNSEATV